ncbi:hypothetical protein BDV95DRAFT_669640 [Massariosphaeria phaeospora]|uniref:Uncharacterized protein n=1 Tax=Massariosphaeria phaeospora TaxID=100035 RepID=A0A7C8M5L1_9PLEO|nr:hypothetical protein BDV95DRAFT_669640 [Massariosphaeria phaeospora]
MLRRSRRRRRWNAPAESAHGAGSALSRAAVLPCGEAASQNDDAWLRRGVPVRALIRPAAPDQPTVNCMPRQRFCTTSPHRPSVYSVSSGPLPFGCRSNASIHATTTPPPMGQQRALARPDPNPDLTKHCQKMPRPEKSLR